MVTRYAVALATTLFLAACGGGGGSPVSNNALPTPATPDPSLPPQPPVVDTDPVQPDRDTPIATAGSSWPFTSHEPMNTDASGSLVLVGGAEIIPLTQWIEATCTSAPRGTCDSLDTPVRQATSRSDAWHILLDDGTSRAELIDYLMADADSRDGTVVRWRNPPTVRMVQGSSVDDEFDTRMAVRLLNSALPVDWQIRFEDQHASAFDPSNGEIIVSFFAHHRFPDSDSTTALGIASTQWDNAAGIQSGRVWMNGPELPSERDRVEVILHEILHTLGREHVSATRFPNTIMHVYAGSQAQQLILHPLDYDALLAVHDRIPAGTKSSDIPTELGAWTESSNHLFGRIGYESGLLEAILYGVIGRNGLVRPWALMADPSPPIASRIGTASWAGRALGLTPTMEPVSGDVGMSVDLAQMTGDLNFTSLETWPTDSALREIGTGSMWGDGDLRYDIAVFENTFRETGGDAGRVTGLFGGQNHENAGGTLRRSDLAAAFGAERQ